MTDDTVEWIDATIGVAAMDREIILAGRLDTIQIGRHGPWFMHVTAGGAEHIVQLDCLGSSRLSWNGESVGALEIVRQFMNAENDVEITLHQRPEFYNVAVKAEFACK